MPIEVPASFARASRAWSDRLPGGPPPRRGACKSRSSCATRSRARSRSLATRLSVTWAAVFASWAAARASSAKRSDSWASASRAQLDFRSLLLLGFQPGSYPSGLATLHFLFEEDGFLLAQLNRFIQLLDMLELTGDLLLQIAGFAGQKGNLRFNRLDGVVQKFPAAMGIGVFDHNEIDLLAKSLKLLAPFAQFAFARDRPASLRTGQW